VPAILERLEWMSIHPMKHYASLATVNGTQAEKSASEVVPAIPPCLLAPTTAVGTETIANQVVPAIPTQVLAPLATADGTEPRVKQIVPAIHIAIMAKASQQFAMAKAPAIGMITAVNLFVPDIPPKIPAPPSTVVGT